MSFKKIFCWLIVFCLIFNTGLFSQDQELLKPKDVSKIMNQIFSQHVAQKGMSANILKHSFKIYIDQFDPDRIYLLEEEVNPYLKMTDAEVNNLVAQYQNNDFSAFAKLNDLIQKSIIRARQYRSELAQNKEALIQDTKFITEDGKDSEWLDPDLKRPFAKNSQELKSRIKNQMIRFIVAEKRRFGEAQVNKHEGQILGIYDKQMQNIEDAYLAVDEEGRSLPQAQKENLFVMHILKALASSLDAHTTFYTTNEAYDMKVRLEKEFQGIGVILQQSPEGISVVSVVDGGPAAKSGLVKPNDLITEIDGTPVSNLDFKAVMDKIHGPNGSTVSLVLKRKVNEGNGNIEKLFNVKLKREEIILNDDRVDVGYESFANGIIGKVTLHSFYQGDGISSEKDVRNAIHKLDKMGNLRGLILDLRENSGGFLTQAVKVAGLFITNGVVVISKYFNGEEHIYRDMDGKATYNGPLVILTSKATASAAEIVAQALQDYGVAIVVGDEHTYGKGTIQSQTITDNEGSSYFKVTVGKYYTVSGKTPQIQGVQADIVVPSQFNHEHIGEEYLDYSLKPDKIKAEYKDDLKDIDPSLRPWYLRYYMPTLQHRVDIWENMVPILKKNSEYRILHNKNYQVFLKLIKGEKIDDPEDVEEVEAIANNHKNYGADDLQMNEAVNIIKDMIYLQAHMRHGDIDSSRATVESSHSGQK